MEGHACGPEGVRDYVCMCQLALPDEAGSGRFSTLAGLAASVKGRKVWYAALVPTEESLHATVCSALAFVCLATMLVPELRRDWKLAAPVMALAASGPGVGLALAGVCAWAGASELPPEETAWQWLRRRLTALPTSIVVGVGCTVWLCLCAPLFLWRMLPGCFSDRLSHALYTELSSMLKYPFDHARVPLLMISQVPIFPYVMSGRDSAAQGQGQCACRSYAADV